MRRETDEIENPKKAEEEFNEQRHQENLSEERGEELKQVEPEPLETIQEHLPETRQEAELPTCIQEQLEELVDNIFNDQRDSAPEQEIIAPNTREDTSNKKPSEISGDRQRPFLDYVSKTEATNTPEWEKTVTLQSKPDETHETLSDGRQRYPEETEETLPDQQEGLSEVEYHLHKTKVDENDSEEERRLNLQFQPDRNRERITEQKRRMLDELAETIHRQEVDQAEAKKVSIKVPFDPHSVALKSPSAHREVMPDTKERTEPYGTETHSNLRTRIEREQETNKKREYYHWWQEPSGSFRPVKKDYFIDIISKKTNETKATGLTDLVIRKLGGTKAETIAYSRLLTGKSKSLETASVKRFCKTFNIPYEELEEQNIFTDRTWPIPLKTPEMAMLASHAVNDGSLKRISLGNGKFGPIWDYQLHYSNEDPVLHWYFKQQVEAVGGTVGLLYPGKGEIDSRADATTARALHESGIPFSPKIINQTELPKIVWKNPQVRKYHFSTTLADEGSVSLGLHKKDGLAKLAILWYRARDVTHKVPRYILEKYPSSQFISVGKIDHDVKELLSETMPRLLAQEFDLLCHTHPEIAWPQPRLDGIYKRKRDGGFSVRWSFKVEGAAAVDILHSKYGMLPGTWKARRFDALYEVYTQLRGTRLMNHEIKEIYKAKRNYPPKIQPWWIKEKMQELFPEAKWAFDDVNINKILSHRKVKYREEK